MKMKLQEVNQTITCDMEFSKFFEFWQNVKTYAYQKNPAQFMIHL
jgi:hypothetical protein